MAIDYRQNFDFYRSDGVKLISVTKMVITALLLVRKYMVGAHY